MLDPKAKTGIDCYSDYSLRARTFQSGLWLRLRLIDPSVPKLRGPLGEPAPALGSFLWRSGGVDDLLYCLGGQLLSAQLTARLADGPRWRLDLEAELDEAADGRRACRLVVLTFCPILYLIQDRGRQPYRHGRIAARCRSTDLLLLVYLN
jgi:hypothetical protein